MTASRKSEMIGPIAVSVAFVMELTLVPLLLPAIQEEFGLSIQQLSWVFNAYGISVAIGVLLGGWLGDASDPRRVFGIGVLLFASGSSLVAVAPNYECLVLGRAMQGFGGGLFSPLVPLLLTRAAPLQPGRMLIIWGSVAGYIASIAPIFYSTLLRNQGWSAAFFIFAAVAVMALGVFFFARNREDRVATSPAELDYSRLFKSPRLWIMFVYVFCTYGAITYHLFRLPLWLDARAFSTANAGFLLSLIWLSFSVCSTFLRNRVDEPLVRAILISAPVLIAAGASLAYFCENFVCLVISSILVGSGLACSNAPSTQLVLRFAPRGSSAISASLDITFARLGGVATVALLAQSDYRFGLAAIFAMSIAALISAQIATRHIRQYV